MTLWKASSVVHVPVGTLVMGRGASPAVAVKITRVQSVRRIKVSNKHEVKDTDRDVSVWHRWLLLFLSTLLFLSVLDFVYKGLSSVV
jgi:hypothetical protein